MASEPIPTPDPTQWSLPSLGLHPLSRVRLDELLQELLDRVSEVVTSRERLRALLDAVVGIGTDLRLHSTLERIVVAACRLAGARYGALGVIGPDRRLVDFVAHGLSPQTHAAIGELPTGRGVLGLLIDDPRPLRLPDIGQHHRSFGFPPNHPPMHSFLGVPILTRDQVFGNLYLAEKQGAAEFTDDDEETVTALAAAAGVVIENARLYADAQHRERWLAATAEITNVLLGEVHRTTALQLVARRAREVADAQLVLVLLHDEEAGQLRVEVAEVDPSSEAAPTLVRDELVGAALRVAEVEFADAVAAQRHVVVENLGEAAPWPLALTTGTALVAPLPAGEELHGVLVVAYRPGEARRVDDDLPLLTTFAGQASLALERARAQDEREHLVILEDRERIARDLHDVVIQRLFATGLQLQTVASRVGKPDLAERIGAAVDELDTTIRDIRSAIFELRTPMSAALRTEIRELVDAATDSLGFRVTLRLTGAIDSAVPDDVRPDLLAVTREALSNAARHARATAVAVSIEAGNGQLALRVRDNGVGINGVERGGLINMRERADRHGGTHSVGPATPGTDGAPGTLVEWIVPLSPSI